MVVRSVCAVLVDDCVRSVGVRIPNRIVNLTIDIEKKDAFRKRGLWIVDLACDVIVCAGVIGFERDFF